MSNSRRSFIQQVIVGAGGVMGSPRLAHAVPVTTAPLDGPDPAFVKPEPVSMAGLPTQSNKLVTVTEVDDYTTGHYTGPLAPSPPHADMNPKKAFVITWRDSPCRFVFGHEASYCPVLELPSGAAMCDQFFEGNLGEAELFNNLGRKEKNSFVDVVQGGPDRVWVRWNYFAVNKDDDTQPRLRGTEDYFAYPNGLVLRRLTFRSLMPDSIVGYSTQPVELFGIIPQGSTLKDVFSRDPDHGDFNVLSVVDLYADRRYDICWDDKGGVRRNGNDDTLAAITASPGCALVIPFRDRLLFAVLGTASGFSGKYNQFIDHSTPGAVGGAGWGQGIWDHWPIGWLNSQGHDWKPGSPYAYHFGSVGQFFVPEGKRIQSFLKDYGEYCKDMDFNRWVEKHISYVLLGSATSWSDIHRIGRAWLDQGDNCAKPESIANIKTS